MISFRDLKGGGDLAAADMDSGSVPAFSPKKIPLSFRNLQRAETDIQRKTLRHKIAISRTETKTVPESKTVASDKDRDALYEEAHVFLNQVLIAVRQQKSFDLEWGFQIMNEIVKFQTPNDSLFLNAIHSEKLYDYVVRHSVNVAIFSTIMGKTLGFDKKHMIEIGMVGLLHDVGMGLIPESIIYKKGRLTQKEFEIMKERCKYGYKILQRFQDKYPYLSECTLQVYERVDGSGYPKSLKGDEIHEYAQIVGLAAVYEALIHSRPQREKFLHFFAAKEIIKTGKKAFKTEHLKALLNIFSVFPLQSHVKLNSGAIGKVIATYPDQLMRPKLRIVFDSQGRKVLTDRIIDLPENPLLYIVDAVADDELTIIDEKYALMSASSGTPQTQPFMTSMPQENTDEPDDEEFFEEVEDEDQSHGQVLHSKTPGKVIGVGLAVCLVLIVAGWLYWEGKPVEDPAGRAETPTQHPVVKSFAIESKAGVGETRPVEEIQNVPEKVDTHRDSHLAPPVNQTAPDSVPSAMEEREDEQAMEGLDANTEKKTTVAAIPDMMADGVTDEPLPVPSLAGKTESRLSGTVAGNDMAQPQYPFSVKLTYFKTKEEAEKSLSEFRKMGLSPYWVKVDLGEEGIWYRVFAGHFETEQQAQKFIGEFNLGGTPIKQTRYSTLIGLYPGEAKAMEMIDMLGEKGFSAYTTPRRDGALAVHVGAFYTREGAQAQSDELHAAGIQHQIIER